MWSGWVPPSRLDWQTDLQPPTVCTIRSHGPDASSSVRWKSNPPFTALWFFLDLSLTFPCFHATHPIPALMPGTGGCQGANKVYKALRGSCGTVLFLWLKIGKKNSAVTAVVVLWHRGERLTCHSGLLLSQQGFDVHWQPQITFTSYRNICFLSMFGLAPMDRTHIQLASTFAAHKQLGGGKKK